MRDPTTWIKLDRNITGWRWIHDPIVLAIWVQLLIRANYKDVPIGDDIVRRGEVYISKEILASEIGITIKQLRTGLRKLEQTGEIRATKKIGKIVVISILCYDRYQGEGQRKGSERAEKGQHIKNIKNNKNIYHSFSIDRYLYIDKENERPKPYTIPTKEEIDAYAKANGIDEEKSSAFFTHYNNTGWKSFNGDGIYDWRAALLSFNPPEKKRSKTERPKRFTDSDGYTYELVNGKYEKVRI